MAKEAGYIMFFVDHHDDGTIYMEDISRGVSGYGETLLEALDAVVESFGVQQHLLCDCDPSELTEEALKYRKRFLALERKD